MVNLQDLNPAQREAVTYCDGPSLVIAGAGSGKTRVLTYKIAYLLEQGMAPWNILALTFTNKAADEMKNRIARQVDSEKAQRLWMGTFHSVFARILRIEATSIGFTSNFTIYDAADSKSLIKTIIREMGLDDKQYKPATVAAHISAAKNRLVSPEAYAHDITCIRADQASRMPQITDIYARYAARCRQADALDFDDILVYTHALFSQHPDIRARYEDRFHFILVDEYQDTNFAQHAIVWQLAEHRQRLAVVGDDAQSIYSFRGANIDNILSFQKLYPGAKLFKLEQNYRSTKNIVGAANSLIRHNKGQIPKEVFSEKPDGQPLHVSGFMSDIEEAAAVAKHIHNLCDYDHVGCHEIAILYRTNAQSRTFEDALRKLGIPYRVFGGLSFYQRKEIKDMIAYFRLAVNPNDEEALRRVINYPARGIGQTTLQKVADAAVAAGVGPWQVVADPDSYNTGISKATAAKLMAFADLIRSFAADVTHTDAATLGRRIAKESGMESEIFRGREPEDISRQENLQELLNGMNQFVDERNEEDGPDRALMTHYLQEVSLISDLEESNDDSDEKVSLMTVHSAKGLEFRIVFIVGMEENLFPNQMATSSLRELEEERRLFYVAITRAEELCYITFAMNRYRYGKQEFSTPSSFLSDIDDKFILKRDPSASRQSSSDAGGPRAMSPTPPMSRFGRKTAPESPFAYRSKMPPTGSHAENAAQPSGSRWHSIFSSGAVAATPGGKSVESATTAQGTLRVGSVIVHARFGRGHVTALTGQGVDAKATVEFDNVGSKQLLLRFAKFTIV